MLGEHKWVILRKRRGLGFMPGMTREEIVDAVGDRNVIERKGDVLLPKSAPNPSDEFPVYLVLVPDSGGLAKVAGLGPIIECGGTGAFRARRKCQIQRSAHSR